jgi:hypothetical protein
MREVTQLIPANAKPSLAYTEEVSIGDNGYCLKVSIRSPASIFEGKGSKTDIVKVTPSLVLWVSELILSIATGTEEIFLINFVKDVIKEWTAKIVENITNIFLDYFQETESRTETVTRIVGIKIKLEKEPEPKYLDGDGTGSSVIITQDDVIGSPIVTGKVFVNRRVEYIPMLGINSISDFTVTIPAGGRENNIFTVEYVMVETCFIEYSGGRLNVYNPSKTKDLSGLINGAVWKGGAGDYTVAGNGWDVMKDLALHPFFKSIRNLQYLVLKSNDREDIVIK